MAKSLQDLLSFAAGEVSPRLDARVDQAKYKSALRTCLNMIPLKQGPLTRRPGTQYIAKAKDQNVAGHNFAARLIKFIFSPATTFVLEFGNHYVRFYSGGQQVTVSSAPVWVTATNYPAGSFVEDSGDSNNIYYTAGGINGGTTPPHLDGGINWVKQSIYEVPSPYNADALTGSIWTTDVWTITPCQINDVVYLVHPDYPPYKLTRFGNTDWVLQEVAFLSPALLDQNATDTTLVPSATTGSGIMLSANAPAWVTANYYAIGNSVLESGLIYNCIVAHVSGTFATDLAAGDWEVVNIFLSGMEGGTWQLANLRPSAYIEYDGVAATGFAAGETATIQARGNWEVHSYGVWSADVAIQRSLDGGQTWDTVRSITGRSDRNVDITGTAVQLALYKISVTNVAVPVNPGATNPRIVFECVDAFLYGLVQIVSITNAYQATANVITELYAADSAPVWVSGSNYSLNDLVEDPGDSNNIYLCIAAITNSTTQPHSDSTHFTKSAIPPTQYWSEAAWSDYRGFPQAITSFQQRVWYASSGFEPQRIWGTVTNDIENLALGDQTNATDAVVFDVNAPGRGPIVWLTAQTDLFAGFSGAEWVLNSGSTNTNGQSAGAAITPTSINAVEHSTWGSAFGVQPYVMGNAVMFPQRQANNIRQMLFSIYTQKYMSQDISALAEHFFTPGIEQIDYQPQWHGQSILWCVTQQGQLCGMTYELDQDVYAWHRHVTGLANTSTTGQDVGFESVCVIDGQGTSDDELWVVVNRKIGAGQVTRYIERMNPNNWEVTFTGPPNPPTPVLPNAFYVDAGITVTNPGSPTVTGLAHLVGRYVVGLADGNAFGPVAVDGSGSIVIPNAPAGGPAVVQVGLAISYSGQPMRIDSDARAGDTQGLVKQISDLYVRVMNSAGGAIGNGSGNAPTWVSGTQYVVGNVVFSPADGNLYACTVNYNGASDPASQPGSWAQVHLPVPLPYVPMGNPFGGPFLVTTPKDLHIQPQPNLWPSSDPIFIVEGDDALPLTVIGIFAKYDITATP